MKLFPIRIVANRSLGRFISCTILLSDELSDSLQAVMSFGVKEKKATSAPLIKADRQSSSVRKKRLTNKKSQSPSMNISAKS